MQDFKLSPSKIVLHEKCERKFYYAYIENIKEPNTPSTIRGTIFHKILEELYKVIDFKKFYGKHWKNTYESLTQIMNTFLELEWKKIGTEYDNVFENEKESKEFLEETKDFVEFYCLKEAYRLYQFFKKNKPEDKWFTHNLKKEILPKSSEEYISINNLRGYIDKTINLFGKGVGIVDYKTSKTPVPHALDKSHLLQLKIYAYLYYKKTGELPKHASIYYSRTGESVFSEIKKTDIPEVEEKINKIRQKSKNKKEYSQHITKLCYYCYYKDICKPAQ